MNERKLQSNNKPELLQIELTYNCNLNCVFCYNPNRNKKIDFQKLDKIIDRISSFNIPQVYLIGGEPSLLGTEKLNEYIEKLSINSSVTIVTNGFITLKGISNKLANIAVSLHGYDAKTHERFNGVEGSYEHAIKSIQYYKSRGLNVRAVVVLSAMNYNIIGKILLRCIEAGVDEIFIDRYEDGGIGASNSNKFDLKPTNNQFREGLTQIIEVRNMELINKEKIGFGTAIPFCVDERLFSESLLSSCGAGTDFCAVTPDGNLRICNQSKVVMGNILDENIEDIWRTQAIQEYRDLNWVDSPCKECRLLSECIGGCRVDENCNKNFVIDYAIRDDNDEIMRKNQENINQGKLNPTYFIENFSPKKINDNDKYFVDRFTHINRTENQYFLVTQFSSARIGRIEYQVIEQLINRKEFSFREICECFFEYEEEGIENLFNQLLFLNAIRKVEND
ncbi:radical SAM/SPASM domain-containing protein [uncultured Dubosiella sp.]|uniref:radical SAM/SPASM domain-containing protein n=1 Tax=uncultured Dubosiella sp. TaxID=1937011 RepID=UPI0025B2AE27|nr:radical SAM protein [uncultured Dubosiella sp.]